jgi:hypothetical protein
LQRHEVKSEVRQRATRTMGVGGLHVPHQPKTSSTTGICRVPAPAGFRVGQSPEDVPSGWHDCAMNEKQPPQTGQEPPATAGAQPAPRPPCLTEGAPRHGGAACWPGSPSVSGWRP